ncbi:MAG: TRAP-type transport system periplasmic protein [bacterium]|nr:MAG: putative extracellular solute-binding protein, TRAP-type dicarboxylate transporter, DctP subunit [bacterium 42_11]MDK2871544.1 TRAP-type transport system periplasmic protein [bacterium]
MKKSYILMAFLLISVFASVALAKVISMNVASHVTPGYKDLLPPEEAFIDDVNVAGEGKIKLNFYHSGTLLKVKELVPGLEAGTADIIFHTTSHTTGSWPIMGGPSLPFIFKSDWDMNEKLKIGQPLFNLIQKVMMEKHGIVFLAFGAIPSQYLWTAKKPVRTPEDLKGMIIRVGGEAEAEAIKALGASPVFMPSGELYEALQRGTIDGLVAYPGTIGGRALYEVLKYCTKIPLSAYGRGIYMKKETWDKLPESVKRIITLAAYKYDYLHLKYAEMVHEQEVWPKIKAKGIEVIEPPEDVVKQFREICKPTWEKWVKTVGEDIGKQFIDLATK